MMMLDRIDVTRVVIAGAVGTVVMTVTGLYAAPLMGLPAMNPAVMLAGVLGGVSALGWAAHFSIGITLAAGYAVAGPFLTGPAAVRGAVYGLAPWLAAQLVVMPLMSMPVFSGSAGMAIGSLVGHLVYGGVVGAIYGAAPSRQPVPQAG